MKPLLVSILMFSSSFGFSQRTIDILSPNKSINYEFWLTKESPFFRITYKGKQAIGASRFSLNIFQTGLFKTGLSIGKIVSSSKIEQYILHTGRNSIVKDHYNESIIPLGDNKTGRKINLVVRVFNDGVAFRYEYFGIKGEKELQLLDETNSFNFRGDPKLLGLFLPNYTSSHEGEYKSLLLSKVVEDTLIDMPLLLELPGNIYAAVTEAALSNYAGAYLSKHLNELITKLSPLPGQPGLKVRSGFPIKSPWRVILLSDRIGTFLESNLLTSLNEPSKLGDIGWLKTGKTTFPWWNGNIVPDSLINPGHNFVTNKYYIDFCARNNIEFHSVVEYGFHPWYVDDGTNFQPGPNADVTTPVPGLNMKEICDYAKSQNVAVRVWVHWAALYPKIDTAFALFEKWGLSGMMIDFMDRDDQEMVRIQEEMLQKAAKHKLHVQFHGAYKPTGMLRTYPNELTREGTLNYEVYKWEKRITPHDDLNIAFVRMIAGPTDYHLGGFRAVPDSLFKVQYSKPLILGTRSHMLAMYVVLESPLGMVCDYPSAYENEPGFEFIKSVPTTWDETKVLGASLHEYLIIGRRKGENWYVGAINNMKRREVMISLDMLPAGTFKATIFADAENAELFPNELNKQERVVKRGDKLLVELASGGGVAVQISPLKN